MSFPTAPRSTSRSCGATRVVGLNPELAQRLASLLDREL